MKGYVSGLSRYAFRPNRVGFGVIALTIGLLASPLALSHSPLVDADLSDWCIGAFSNTAPGGGRVEDTSVQLVCGQCSITSTLACSVNSDCPGLETCTNLTSKTELAWWDNRTDGAVNDLGTVVSTYDNTNLYFAAELWVDPDPVSLPFGEIGIDVAPGGNPTWHDPAGALTNPGHCSVSTDRACTSDADCHFCMISQEPFPSTRVRSCGSACDPDIGDSCDMTQTCVDLGSQGQITGNGAFSNPDSAPEYLLVFDFSRWLVGLEDAVMLMENAEGVWRPVSFYFPAVNPGASGGSGGPPGSVEVAIPWADFGCTGCPDACDCPAFGPGDEYRYQIMIARGTLSLDYTPDGAIEDVISETIGGLNTTSPNDCGGFGIGNTDCEIADGSLDGYIPEGKPMATPGGAISNLVVDYDGGTLRLSWDPSCSEADNDYEVYEGDVGMFSSHIPVPGLCSTAGATSASFTPGAGSKYYLVVPSDGNNEGSYGLDSTPSERPASAAACTTQLVGVCP